jgi:hypothetical protein
MDEARELAQQKPASADWRLYWYPDEAVVKGNPRRESDMTSYRIDVVLDGIVKRKSTEPVPTMRPAQSSAAQQN